MTKFRSIHDSLASRVLTGRLELWICPRQVAEEDVPTFIRELDTDPRAFCLFQGENLVVSSANTVMAKMLQRDFTDYMPFYITVGDGGDLEQEAKVDTGGRVGPEVTDTEIRSVVAKLPIVQVTSPPSTSPSPSPSPESTSTMWTYVAVARPHEALTISLNELGVETLNGTLFSHFITVADEDGRATKYVKSSLEWLIVRWTFSLELMLS